MHYHLVGRANCKIATSSAIGQKLNATENGALAFLLFSHHSTGCFWIDSICINQREDTEKGHQMALRKEVYTRAVKSIAWLGSLTSNMHLALDNVQSIGKKHLAVTAGRHLAADNVTLSLYGLPERASPLWSGFGDFLHRPWFTRLWVMQEAILPATVEIMCGQWSQDIELERFITPERILRIRCPAITGDAGEIFAAC